MLLCSSALAAPVSSSGQVAEYIQSSTGRIHLFTLNLYSQPVAEALHQALTQRGVQLYLYTTCEALVHPSTGSMLLGLAWAGAALFVIDTAQESGVLVVDDRYAFRGPLVYRATTPHDQVTHVFSINEQGYRLIADFVNRLASTAVPVDMASTLQGRSPCEGN
jgi:hypothetical protein